MSSVKIKEALKGSYLSQAFTLLESRINEIGNYDLKNALDEALTTYRAMLMYLLQGYQDAEITNRRNELIRTLFIINGRADRHERLLQGDKQSRYVSTQKFYASLSLFNIQQRLEVELSDEEHEEELCKLFNFTWTSDVWTKVDYEIASNIISSDDILTTDKAVFISAITLSLMEMFDVRKLHLLFDAYLSPEGVISQRAIVGIILILKIYNSRLTCFPEIQARISIYAEDPHFVKEAFSTLLMLQFSCITNKITDKMQNDIMPMLLKGDRKKRLTPDEIKAQMSVNGENPDWVDKEMQKKIHEISDMQIEGADVYFSTFRYMKGYHFFNKIPHWFYPFNEKSHLLGTIDEATYNSLSSFMKMVIKNDLFCDNDAHSFFFMMKSITSMEQDMIKRQVGEQISNEELDMLAKDIAKKTRSNQAIRRNYIFDLYRFFHCYPFYNQFDNPFKMKKKVDGKEMPATFSPLEIGTLQPLTFERDEMQTLAEFFMRKEFYYEALEMYKIIDPKEIEEEANLWQKVGFCLQKMNKDKAALKNYLIADRLLPDSRWTMYHIAQLASKLGQYQTAIDYYDMLLQQDSDNLTYLENKALAQIQIKDYEGALTTYYKLNYLDENNSDFNYGIILCLLHTGQTEKASELVIDCINKGNDNLRLRIINSWFMYKSGQMESAFYCIREAMALCDLESSKKDFKQQYYDCVKEFAKLVEIDSNIAYMLFDSVILDIR